MTEVVESELPGIGKKFKLELVTGGSLTVIVHIDGKKNIYFRESEDRDAAKISLTDEEAKTIGSILSETHFRITPFEQLQEAIIKKATIQSFKIPQYSPLIGRMISDLDIRKRTEVSILGVTKGSETIPNPDPSMILSSNDILIVFGAAENMKKLQALIEKG